MLSDHAMILLTFLLTRKQQGEMIPTTSIAAVHIPFSLSPKVINMHLVPQHSGVVVSAVASQQEGPGLISHMGRPFLCGVCMLFVCLFFPPGALILSPNSRNMYPTGLISSQCPKMHCTRCIDEIWVWSWGAAQWPSAIPQSKVGQMQRTNLTVPHYVLYVYIILFFFF